MDRAQELLQQTFGLKTFRPGQREVIDVLQEGRSALAIFPTGGGKSLCYQLPALQFDGLTLVVSPLIALMKDQVDALNQLGVPAARLDSSRTGDEVKAIYRGLDRGELKLLYVAPERLANERFLARLARLNISLMAVDEAHCVSEWGHNFRPDYLKLAQLARTLNVGRVLALTATATPKVAEQICRNFDIAPQDHIQTGFYRPNLHIGVSPCTSRERNQRLLELLNQRPAEPAIVYVTLQKTALAVAEFLSQQGYAARPYHAGLKDEERSATQEAFMTGETPIVVATIAFGMGIDKSDIRAIYHYNLPKSLENYMQEIGRAGRDGGDARCELLACRDDLTVLENFTYGDTPDPSALAELVHWLCTRPDEFDLSTYELSQQFDVRPLVLNTLLTYLELEGVISATAPFYTEYKIAFSQPQADILARFDADRAGFLQQVFATGKAGRTWLTLKPAEAAQALGEDSMRIVKALNYLEQQALIELKVAGLRQGYRMQQRPEDIEALNERMARLFQQREERDIDRLHRVCDWAESPGCLQQPLMAYFGETLEQPCGRCSGCRGEHRALPPRHTRPVDERILKAVIDEQHAALAQPRPLARFLCGIGSPRASRAKLGRHPRFGALVDTPFTEVLHACQQWLDRG
ncbi:RecQ family ATP-dependent DNA helicase [Marinimicrobium sp. C2-29]|uniref:RecQ family ATP-dependent DNA helicase n=1 Tax=Marinimicrobium sp. C2-29 TaxID=3139825 RepID=UPI0031396E4D